MNIGVSLSPAFLCGQASSPQQARMLEKGPAAFLAGLHEAGCTHIELRSVRRETPEEAVSGAVRTVCEAGLSLTVHGALTDESAEAFWGRLSPALSAQPELCVTVHSASSREKTLLLLRRMSEYALVHHPGARLALENNRSRKGDNIDLVECAGVSRTLEALNLSNLGACWDFGHFYWDTLAHPALLPEELPPPAFLKRAVHTHIHSVHSDTTHFPLTMGSLPLARYLRALQAAGYAGVFNLEPEPERWEASLHPAQEIIRSVYILKDALHGAEEVI